MTLTVKLEPELEQALTATSTARGVSKSALVKTALRAYLASEPVSAYEAGRELFGRHGSGEGDLSVRRRERYVELVDAKRRGRR